MSDFAQWKQVYDDFRATQQRLGVTGEAVYRTADDPSEVTVAHDFATLEAAQQFVANDEVRGAMERAGVAGEPTIWFGDKV